jgi:transposase
VGTAATTATVFAGIDVSKDTLDCCLLLPHGRVREHTFGNDARGHAALLAWADRHTGGQVVHFCMEATGPYSEAPATFLAGAGRHVSVVNPTRIKYAGLARGRGNKTDRADARLIAEYAARETPPAWQPPAPEVRELQGLVRRIDDLTAAAAREKGRLASPALTGPERRSVARTIRFLEREAGKLRAEADAVVVTCPRWWIHVGC